MNFWAFSNKEANEFIFYFSRTALNYKFKLLGENINFP